MQNSLTNELLLRIKFYNLKYIELKEVWEALNSANVNYAAIKGEVLSLQAYGSYGMRSYGDIDILISRKNIRMLENLLLKKGFTSTLKSREDKILMMTSSHQVASWTKITDDHIRHTIDLNFDIFWGEYTGTRIDMDDFLADVVELSVYGMKIKTLPIFKAFIQLILHHYKEMNSLYHLCGHKSVNYNMFKDLYNLWKNNTDSITLEKLYEFGEEHGIKQYIFYMLYYTNEIFKDNKLDDYVNAFKSKIGIDLLDCYGLSKHEIKRWNVDFETRLQEENMYELIKNDLTESDIEKIRKNKRIFD